MKYFLISIFLLIADLSFSQSVIFQDTFFIQNEIQEKVDVSNVLRFYRSKYSVKDLSEVRSKIVTPSDHLKNLDPTTSMDSVLWTKFYLKNNFESNIHCILVGINTVKSEISVTRKNKLSTYKNGFISNRREWLIDYTYNGVPLTLGPGETIEVIFRDEYLGHIEKDRQQISLQSKTYHRKAYLENVSTRSGLTYFKLCFMILMMFIFLFTVFQFILNKDWAYLFYATYLFSLILHFLHYLEIEPNINIIYSYIPVLFYKFQYLPYLSYAIYGLFFVHFVNVKKIAPEVLKPIYIIVILIVVLFFITILQISLGYPRDVYFSNYMRFRLLMSIPLMICFVYVTIKNPSKLTIIFLIGSLLIGSGSAISAIMHMLDFRIDGYFWQDRVAWAQVSILAEILVFSLGIGYKTKQAYDERDESKNEYINQLNKNQILQDRLNNRLKQEVAIKSTELTEKNNEKLKAEYESKIIHLEFELRKMQMNPHFIFNSLNSIKYYALTKGPRETSKYITTFSKLMRTILQNSDEKLISLYNEIETIKLYVEVERKRFEEAFEFNFSIDPELNLHSNFLPPMLIQPYIENAIWHGIMHLNEIGRLDIRIIDQIRNIRIEIEDNGIGRKKSAEIGKKKKDYLTKSLGTKITAEMINMINEMHDIDTKVNIIDLEEYGKPAGTLIQIVIPKINKKEIWSKQS